MNQAVNAYTSTEALRSALAALVGDVLDYERTNGLYPNPGRKFCWQSTENACALLQSLGVTALPISSDVETRAALCASPAPSTEGTPSASQLADMIPEWMAARLLRGERAIEASEFRQRDEIIGFGLARRAWPNETGDAWQTWLTPLGLEVRDLLAKKMAARTALAGVTAPMEGK